jgi:hypothetical protein
MLLYLDNFGTGFEGFIARRHQLSGSRHFGYVRFCHFSLFLLEDMDGQSRCFTPYNIVIIRRREVGKR